MHIIKFQFLIQHFHYSRPSELGMEATGKQLMQKKHRTIIEQKFFVLPLFSCPAGVGLLSNRIYLLFFRRITNYYSPLIGVVQQFLCFVVFIGFCFVFVNSVSVSATVLSACRVAAAECCLASVVFLAARDVISKYGSNRVFVCMTVASLFG